MGNTMVIYFRVISGTEAGLPAVRSANERDLEEKRALRAPGSILEHFNVAKITPKVQTFVDLAMFRFFICCALSWTLLDNIWFRTFVYALAASYVVPTRSSFFSKYLSSEIAVVNKVLRGFLADRENLSLSFDGWSTLKHEEIYTLHITTPGRRSIFIDGHVFTDSVTGNLLLDVILNKVTSNFLIEKPTQDADDATLDTPLGTQRQPKTKDSDEDSDEVPVLPPLLKPTQLSSVAGDGGPNVRRTKQLFVARYPWILNIYDPCHNLSLYMKDVGAIFKDTVLVNVSMIANYFGKSNLGTAQLAKCRKVLKITHGIASATDTRFSSLRVQSVSVKECMPAIRRCMDLELITFKTKATKKLLPFVTEGTDHYMFMANLGAFIDLTESIANAILSLEGLYVNCADVFYAWVCIACSLDNLLGSKVSLQPHRRAVIEKYNARFTQMMIESTEDIFLFGYFIHPKYHIHGGLRLDMPALADGATLSKEQYSPLFSRLITVALKLLMGERKRTQKYKSSAAAEALVAQLIAWAYNREPFRSRQWAQFATPLEYWKCVGEDSSARILGVIGIKVFSIVPSEICDERTASRLGWFNSARRSSMTPQNLINSARLHDYYTHGYNNDSPKGRVSQAFIHVPSPVTAPDDGKAIRSVPTLADLLNPVDPTEAAPVDLESLEDTWFNRPDPYDLDEAERVPAPTVVRTNDRFAIFDIIKPDDGKLVSLIASGGMVEGDAFEPELSSDGNDEDEAGGGWDYSNFI
ncbi:unnamed protein product [Mycena citricolor]|uniref:DUF659 domain-containing protein n=1 Tax=Mycena citricolor TaxID=2018698 RepID=A0AAD2HAP6_9AGAR|nr:unnamed protein product [Mycena citricolor]